MRSLTARRSVVKPRYPGKAPRAGSRTSFAPPSQTNRPAREPALAETRPVHGQRVGRQRGVRPALLDPRARGEDAQGPPPRLPQVGRGAGEGRQGRSQLQLAPREAQRPHNPSSGAEKRPAGARGASLGQGMRAPGQRRGPGIVINLSRGGGRFQAGGEAAEHGRLSRQRGHSPQHSRGIVACRLASGTSPSMYAFRAQPAGDPAFRRPAPPECGQRQTARRFGARSLPASCRCPTVLTVVPSCMRTLGSRHGSVAVTYENRCRRTPTSATGAARCAWPSRKSSMVALVGCSSSFAPKN
jgi:hypothetical protein